MYLCKECLIVYKEYDLKFDNNRAYEVSNCPDLECEGRVTEIDELILPAIIELNKKRYKTKFCCSGHLYGDEGNIHTYIYFENMPSSIPESFEARNDAIYCRTRKFNSSSRPNKLKRFDQLYAINRELYEWAIGLPMRN